jgi:transcriptional regulator with PAS, ATPase and Fis domain
MDYRVTQETTLKEAIGLIKEMKWEVLPVTDSSGKAAGVFTRSGLYQMVLDGRPLSSAIAPYIKKEVHTIQADTPYEQIEKLVQTSQVGTGVVTDKQERVIGLLTKSEMVMSLLRSSNALKEQLEMIVAHSNLGVLLTDEKRQIVYVNERLCSMLALPSAELLHQPADILLPELKKTLTEQGDVSPVTLDQYNIILHVSTYPTTPHQKGYIILFQDLSELEKMAEELHTVKQLKKTLETAIDHAYDGILMTDERMDIKMVSPSLLELFDLQREDVLNQPVESILPQFHLSNVYQSETAEISDFMEINGITYIVHRIPILQDGTVIGAIGKVMFRQLNEVNELFKKLQKAEKKASFYHDQYKQAEAARFTWKHISSVDPYMEKLKKSAAKAAKGRSTILIRGESGTGKELFAHAIHNGSARGDGTFVVVNCAAIPEDLLESEFFGYDEGAFTGAKQRGKVGKFDLANGGTLFLDEIGDMSLSLQAKLLRVLQEREFYRVGGTKRIQVDVRIIAATNRNLEEMVEKGQFREDLYYRLNVISLHVPPLRERIGDVDYLVKKLMKELNAILGTTITGIEGRAREVLLSYDWPGNVRELRNVMERAMTFAEHGKIQMEDLPDYMLKKRDPAIVQEPKGSWAEAAEMTAIEKALRSTGGNKAEAARVLGISRSGLYEKLKKYQLNA